MNKIYSKVWNCVFGIIVVVSELVLLGCVGGCCFIVIGVFGVLLFGMLLIGVLVGVVYV